MSLQTIAEHADDATTLLSSIVGTGQTFCSSELWSVPEHPQSESWISWCQRHASAGGVTSGQHASICAMSARAAAGAENESSAPAASAQETTFRGMPRTSPSPGAGSNDASWN